MMRTLGIVAGGRGFEHGRARDSAEVLERALEGSDLRPRILDAADPADLEAARELDLLLPLVQCRGVDELRGAVGARMLGNPAAATDAALDKPLARRLLARAGVPVLPGVVVSRRELAAHPRETVARVVAEIHAPWFVKTAHGSASAGSSVATDEAALGAALRRAALLDTRVLVEPFVDAREIEVEIVAGMASLPGELVFRTEFFDIATRTTPGALELVIPAMVSAEGRARLQAQALAAAAALGTLAVARVELLLDRNTHQVVVNEVNPLPTFAPETPFPRLWEASGVCARGLLARLTGEGEEGARPGVGT